MSMSFHISKGCHVYELLYPGIAMSMSCHVYDLQLRLSEFTKKRAKGLFNGKINLNMTPRP